MTNGDKDLGLIDFASSNQDLKQKISDIIENIDSLDQTVLENQVIAMLQNMMNFFSLYVEEIPNFDSLSPEQQQDLMKKFRSISRSLKKRNIKSIDEMTQVFVFTVLNGLGESIEELRDLTIEEILHKKHKTDFKNFLRRAADFELAQIELEKTNEKGNFISDAIKLGVMEALKEAKLEINFDHVNKSALEILEEAHKSYKNNQRSKSI